jgi:hypothetical protein
MRARVDNSPEDDDLYRRRRRNGPDSVRVRHTWLARLVGAVAAGRQSPLGREAFWRYGEPNSAGTFDRSAVSADGRRLDYSVPGPDACGAVYRFTVEVVETPTAVMLTTNAEIVSTGDPDEVCVPLATPPVPYPVDLAESLGNRVVVTAHVDAGTEPVGVPTSPPS